MDFYHIASAILRKKVRRLYARTLDGYIPQGVEKELQKYLPAAVEASPPSSVYGPFSARKTKYFLRDDGDEWFVWFDDGEEHLPDVEANLADFLRRDENKKWKRIGKKAKELGWKG